MTRLQRTLGTTAVAGVLVGFLALPAAAQSGVVLERHGDGTVEVFSGREIILLLNRDPNLALRAGRYPGGSDTVLPLDRPNRGTVVRVGPDGKLASEDGPGFFSRTAEQPHTDPRWDHLVNEADTYTNHLGGAR